MVGRAWRGVARVSGGVGWGGVGWGGVGWDGVGWGGVGWGWVGWGGDSKRDESPFPASSSTLLVHAT